MNLTIGLAAPADFELIGGLCVRAYSAGGHLQPGDSYAEVLSNVADRAALARVVVARVDDVIAGTVTICEPGSPYAELSSPGELEFRFLAVEPSCWGQGIGEALVAECELHARDAGARRMVICVIDINEGGHRFYQRLHYIRCPERDWSPRLNIELLCYVKQLT